MRCLRLPYRGAPPEQRVGLWLKLGETKETSLRHEAVLQSSSLLCAFYTISEPLKVARGKRVSKSPVRFRLLSHGE